MRVLLITDIHGETGKLSKILSREEYDAVLCAGDLSDASQFDDYEANLVEVLESFNQQGKLVKAIPGNMDPERDCVEKLREYRLNLHKRVGSFDSFDAVGFGGGQTPFDTFYEPEGSEIKETISVLRDRMKSDTCVAVIHQPPEGKLDVVDNEHTGSTEVRELIEESDFDLMLTGHIHEARGIDTLGGTKMINPGPVANGYYGVAEIGREIELEMKQL